MDDTGAPPDWASLSDAPPKADFSNVSGGASTVPTPTNPNEPNVSSVPGGFTAVQPTPADNPNPLTNGEVPAAEPTASGPDWASLSDTPPSATDKLKAGLTAFSKGAGDLADDIVRPFVSQQALDAAPSKVQELAQFAAAKHAQITASHADPLTATENALLGGDPSGKGEWDVAKDTYGRAEATLAAGAGQIDKTVPEVGTVVAKAMGLEPALVDKVRSLISGTPTTTAYDWWNRNAIQPQKDFAAQLGAQSSAYAEQAGVLGTGAQIAGQALGQYGEMAMMGPEEGATALASALPKEGFAGAYNIIKDALTESARYSTIPAVVNASKANEAVYQQTGDPLAAARAGLMSAGTTWVGNTLPLSIQGPLIYRLATGGVSGMAASEFTRQLNNTTLPANLQDPFSWKGVLQSGVTGSVMAGLLGSRVQEDHQVAYLRYNGIQDAAAQGNQGAKRTADVIDTLSQVTNNIDNTMVDAAVYGVTVANTKMAKPHQQLQAEDPRYAAIFKATQNGPAAVDPATGQQIARDAYANEVSINAAFDKYTQLGGKQAKAIALAKQAAVAMDVAHKVVPKQELDLFTRWAAYEQPNQMQFNEALNNLVQTKQAPDAARAKYGVDFDKDGVPNQIAFQRDSAARPDAYDAFYAPSPKVEQALQQGGYSYYRMADGRLSIRGHNTAYTGRVFAHVHDQTGILPLEAGETYDKSQSADDTTGQGGAESTGAESAQGQQAQVGGQAEAGQPQQPHGQQDGHEGAGQGDGTGRVVGNEGAGAVAQGSENLTPRAQPVADALAKAGVEGAHVDNTGRVILHPEATPEDAAKAIDVAERDAAEHPESDRRTLTDKERAGGHYPMGKLLLPHPDGNVPVNVETPKGGIRRALPESGENWSIKARDPYGYIPGTISTDGQPLDVVLGPKAYDPDRPVAVLSQHSPKTGAFDEPKVVMGAKTKGEAMAIYGRQYPTGMVNKLLPKGKDNIVLMSRAKFDRYWKSKATDVPPHPVSGAPLLSLRTHADFEGETGTANMDDIQDKVDAVNAKHGTDLTYNFSHDTITGQIPAAKATAIHKSFSRLDGYAGSKVNGKSLGQPTEAAGSREESAPFGGASSRDGHSVDRVLRRMRPEGSGIPESPRAPGTEKAVSDAPIFHAGHSAHPVSVVGVHYSNTPNLHELDPTMAGTGSAGGERRSRGMGRFGNSGDPMDAMTSFYVRMGKELPVKESAVAGSHPYEARLNNLYDIKADPDGILERAEKDGTIVNKDSVLESIHEAGYDGYLYDALPGQQGKVATVFGVDSKIPVKDVGRDYLAKPTHERTIGQSDAESAREKAAKVKKELAEKLTDSTKDKLKDLRKEEGEPRLMFAGEKAATGDKGALKYAQKMEQEEKARGTSDKEIETLTHGMTGWSRGADGKWRFEINDKDSQLKPEALDPTSALGRELHSEKGVPVGQLLEHPALYEAYPQIAQDVHVKVEPRMPAEAGAMFDHETNTLLFHELSKYDKTGDESVHSVILHELQHFIQRHEDHATGGNPMEFLGPMRDQKSRLNAQKNILDDAQEKLRQKFFDEHPDSTDEDMAKWESTDPQMKMLNEHQERIQQLVHKGGLSSYQSMMGVAVQKYMRIAGESEAYNTQERQHLTDAERRAQPPSFTEKYPRAEQIVRFGDDDIAMHMKSADQASALFEVAPDPHNAELTDRFAALKPERRTQITHELNDSITPDILRTMGVRADHFLSTFGGYGDHVNPSLGAQFRDGISKEDAYRVASAAGHVFNQDSVIVLGHGMGDKTGMVRIDMHGPKDYNAMSRLYGQLRKDLGDKVGGFTGHDSGIDILNFNKDVDTKSLAQEIADSIAKLPDHDEFHVTPGETEAHFIGKEADDNGESYATWLRSKPENQALDDLRGRATQQLEGAITRETHPEQAGRDTAEKPVDQVAQRQASVERGNRDADQRDLREAAHAVLGDSKHVVGIDFVHDEAGLPADLRNAVSDRLEGKDGKLEGVFDPSTGRVFILTKNVRTPERAAWVAAHEVVGHKGFRALIDAHPDVKLAGRKIGEVLNETTDRALTNPTVRQMAEAISAARDVGGQREAGEEALAELSAAARTGDWDRIRREYGVTVPSRMRQETKGAVSAFMRKAQQLVEAITSKFTGKAAPFSNDDVRELIEHSHQQVMADEQARALRESRAAGLPDDTAPLMSLIPSILRRSRATLATEPRAPGESDAKWRARVMLKSRGAMRQAVSLAKMVDAARQKVGRLDQRAMFATLEREHLKAETAFHGAEVVFDKTPDAVNLDQLDRWETGQTVTSPEHAMFFNAMKDGFDSRIAEILRLKPDGMKGFVDNYFPHLWKDPLAARQWVQGIGKRPLSGNKNFAKDRYWPTIKEGMDSGLQPVSTNPVDAVLRRFGEMDKYIGQLRLMDTLKQRGWLKKMLPGEKVPEGYGRVDDPAFEIAGGMQGYYAVPTGIARDITNYLKPGLNQYKGWRAFRAVQNGIVQSELGWSGFHAGFTTLENLTLHLSTAAARLVDGDLVGGMKTLVEAPLSIVTSPMEGRMLNKAWRDPSLASPETQAILSALEAGGAHQGMSKGDYTQAIPALMRAVRRGEAGKAALETLPAVGQAGSWLIHNWLVPNQKMSARVTVFKQLLDHFAGKLGKDRGDYTGILDAMSPTATKQIAARVVDIVDDRLGQMNYDNQFWNTNLRMAGQASFLSLGWLVGEVRTVTGGVANIPRLWRPEKLLGALDKAGQVTDATLPRLDFRTAYLMVLAAVMSGSDALLQKGMTGQWPSSLKDLFMPRTGRKNPDGSDERLTLPSYWKDHYELVAHTGKTIANKINPIFAMTYEAITNQDYFGTEIRSPHAPAWKQAEQVGKFFVKQMAPFTYTNMQKSAQAHEGAGMKLANAIGVNRASAAASRTDFQSFVAGNGNKGYGNQRMTEAESIHVRAMNQAEAELRAGQTPDWTGLSLKDRLRAEKLAKSEKPELQFKKLSFEDKLEAWDKATPAERQEYHLRQHLVNEDPHKSVVFQRLDPEEQAAALKHYRDIVH